MDIFKNPSYLYQKAHLPFFGFFLPKQPLGSQTGGLSIARIIELRKNQYSYRILQCTIRPERHCTRLDFLGGNRSEWGRGTYLYAGKCERAAAAAAVDRRNLLKEYYYSFLCIIRQLFLVFFLVDWSDSLLPVFYMPICCPDVWGKWLGYFFERINNALPDPIKDVLESISRSFEEGTATTQFLQTVL